MQLKLLGFLLFFFTATAMSGIRVTDNHGRVIELAQPAQRVISLAPHVTENIYRVGGGDRLVGVASYSDYPAQAAAKPVIGNYQNFNLEMIIALKPDLVIAWPGGNPALALDRIEKLGIPVYYSDPLEFTDIAHSLRAFGALLQTPEGEIQAQAFEQRLRAMQAQYSHRKVVKVFYQLWQQPLLTLNRNSFIDRVISLCGGANLFRDHQEDVPRLSIESVLASHPDVILTGEDVAKDWDKVWLEWPQIPASRNRHLYQLNEDLLYRPTVRLLDGAEAMCQALEAVRRNTTEENNH